MKITVLDRSAMGMDLDFSILKSIGELDIYDITTQAQAVARIEESDIILTNKVKITAQIMQGAKKLKLICVFATGYDNIDIAYAKANGIAVCNVPSYSTESVTLFTIATALSLQTHLLEYREHISSGEYSRGVSANRLTPIYHEIYGKTWGILGCGTIGKRVGEVARSLGCRVITYQRHKSDTFETVDFQTLMRESDILSLHCPLTEGTRGIIGEEALKLMKRSAILINEARGAVCNEDAVAKAILDGSIGAFGSDVYSAEPFNEQHPMFKIKSLPNVCLTPHAAWAAYESRTRALKIVFDNMKSFLGGEVLNRTDI